MGGGFDNSDNKLNVELNLVPFIDLLSSLTLFLLVTAVWIQVGTIPASVESSGKARASSTANYLTVHLTPAGFQLTWPNSVSHSSALPRSIATNHGEFDFIKLEKVLLVASKSKTLPPAAVSSEDSVEYGKVVETIDSMKKSGFINVALSTN